MEKGRLPPVSSAFKFIIYYLSILSNIICIYVCLQVLELVPQRDAALQDELHKQNSNDKLRASFASQANKVGAHIKAKMEVKCLPMWRFSWIGFQAIYSLYIFALGDELEY